MRKFYGWALLPGVLMGLGARCEARPLWPVPPLSSFNGGSWGNLRLGQTTFRQIQANYETGRGAYERSTELTQPKNAPLRVDLLWDKRGDSEVLEAITVRFLGVGPRRELVEKLLDPELGAQNFYPKTRYEPWQVASLGPRGAALFTLGEGETEIAPLLVLCVPGALDALSMLSTEHTPVEERFDPHRDEPKIAEFGRVEVSFRSGDDDLSLPWSERSRVRDQIELADASGTLRFSRGATGKYEVSATARENGKKGGSVSASVTIEGEGPYGTLRATGSDSNSWSWSKREQERDEPRDRYELNRRLRESYRDAVGDARTEAERSFARQMEKSGPPPLEQLREQEWREIIQQLRQTGRNQALYPAILR